MPIREKTKTNNTFMMLLLGIIGMWLWIPNKREINKLPEKQKTLHTTPGMINCLLLDYL
jgi:hypothetical protein